MADEALQADADDADVEFRLAALHVDLAIHRAQRGEPGALETAERWLEMLRGGDFSFVPDSEECGDA